MNTLCICGMLVFCWSTIMEQALCQRVCVVARSLPLRFHVSALSLFSLWKICFLSVSLCLSISLSLSLCVCFPCLSVSFSAFLFIFLSLSLHLCVSGFSVCVSLSVSLSVPRFHHTVLKIVTAYVNRFWSLQWVRRYWSKTCAACSWPCNTWILGWYFPRRNESGALWQSRLKMETMLLCL